MAYKQELAQKMIEAYKLEPTIPAGNSHDFRADDFDEDDFKDTAKKLISSGQITANIQNDYAGLYLAFRD
ncbi:hypothetical protein [Streptococcus hyointestinalis]|uniref:hypothetical protein n=1 Tax=Streptococcus hyointestinalis TaxID=1337 RepID=UPI0013DE96F9|nr:hypothetical protein [Streptococcus hyointestinalis]